MLKAGFCTQYKQNIDRVWSTGERIVLECGSTADRSQKNFKGGKKLFEMLTKYIHVLHF